MLDLKRYSGLGWGRNSRKIGIDVVWITFCRVLDDIRWCRMVRWRRGGGGDNNNAMMSAAAAAAAASSPSSPSVMNPTTVGGVCF